jgi:Arc/MetJ family transcription regulator
MRATVTVDDELWNDAAEYAGVNENSEVVRIALRSYVQLQAARALAAMGGTAPDFKPAPRRRPHNYRNPE